MCRWLYLGTWEGHPWAQKKRTCWPPSIPLSPCTLLIPLPMDFLSPGSGFRWLISLQSYLQINTQNSQGGWRDLTPSKSRRKGNTSGGEQAEPWQTQLTCRLLWRVLLLLWRKREKRVAGAGEGRMKLGSGIMARLRFLSWPPWGFTAFWEGQSWKEQLPYPSSTNSSICSRAPISQAQTPGSVFLTQAGVQRAGKSRIPAISSLGLPPSSFSAPQR